MVKISRLIIMLSGGLTAAFLLFLMYALSNGRIPTDESWLFEHINDSGFNAQLNVEQRTGGGHFYAFDGRDLWMRFRDARSSSSPELSTLYNSAYRFQPCSAEQQESIRTFFYEVFENPMTPWSDLSEHDRQSLTDTQNLRCLRLGAIENKFGDFPKSAGTWWLYNIKTQFHYFRYANFN